MMLAPTTSTAANITVPIIIGTSSVKHRLQGQRPEAGQGEDALGEHDAGQQAGDVHAQHGQHRNQGVAQGVLEQHHRLRQAAGAGGADVILI